VARASLDEQKVTGLMKVIKDLWHGGVPLSSTNLAFAVATGLCIQGVIFVIVISAQHAGAFVAVVTGAAVAGFGHQLFMLGVIWRGASKCGRPICRNLTKTAVVLGIFSISSAMADLAKPTTFNYETLRTKSAIVNTHLLQSR